MRPSLLDPLFAGVTGLPGIGAKLAKLVERVAGPRVVDLCWHLPTGLVDRRFMPKVAEAPEGAVATLAVVVDRHERAPSRKHPHRVRCRDDTGYVTLVYFHASAAYLEKLLPEGEPRLVSGTVERFRDDRQIAHPDRIWTPEEAASAQLVEPLYPLTEGLSGRVLGKAVDLALARAPDLPEWLDTAFKAAQAWPDWRDALAAAHMPDDAAALAPEHPTRRRLAYDELLASQLAMALMRARERNRPGWTIAGPGDLARRMTARLPFALTADQAQAIADIRADMGSGQRMLRLIQGDVGSGKTLVALAAMLDVAEAGAQAALMAPTEVLARQHHATIGPLAAALGIEAVLLTGRDTGAARGATLAALAGGSAAIAIGTHALFQEGVQFADLALAVIDEQHRFGVQQRLALGEKGRAPHVLVMTATPIPRSLMLTAYGDLDATAIRDKPAGRTPVDTRVLSLARLDEVIGAVARTIDTGAKVFWICPLVSESEVSDLAAAEDRAAHLRALFGDRVGLAHGQLKGKERDAVMAGFATGPIAVLVATTVVEVGVDVPDASVIVIEHAERFGLAQLHQLRGRVGRGARPSTCLLLYTPPLSESAQARLRILRETDDGFRIAEEDLRLRGAGEVLGTRQSGQPRFRLADLAVHGELLAAARDDARLIMAKDPGLATPRGEALRCLLYLFERDAAIRYARSG